ncbi:MAG: hypothetical protein RBT75_06925, partial [Anaerolineae bacterium]|nr:hypothetical protein [Anaerolineae bacterium]
VPAEVGAPVQPTEVAVGGVVRAWDAGVKAEVGAQVQPTEVAVGGGGLKCWLMTNLRDVAKKCCSWGELAV